MILESVFALIASRTRFSPAHVVRFLAALLWYSGIILGIASWDLLGYLGIEAIPPVMRVIYAMLLVVFACQLVLVLVAQFSRRVRYRHQAFVSVAACIVAFVLAVEPFFLIYIFAIDRDAFTQGSAIAGPMSSWLLVVSMSSLVFLCLFWIALRPTFPVWVLQETDAEPAESGDVVPAKRGLLLAAVVWLGVLAVWLIVIAWGTDFVFIALVNLITMVAILAGLPDLINITRARIRSPEFRMTYEQALKNASSGERHRPQN